MIERFQKQILESLERTRIKINGSLATDMRELVGSDYDPDVHDRDYRPKINYANEDLATAIQNTSDKLDITPEENIRIKELQTLSAQVEDKVMSDVCDIDQDGLVIDYQSDLNPRQLSAIVNTEGPLLVIAGAGSGKTRVITYKVAYLIERGVPAHQILLMTFTRKAAKEMLDRVDQLLQGNYKTNVQGGTFHAYANKTLRKYGSLASIPPNFSIIDLKDAEDIIDLVKTENDIKSHIEGRQFPKKSKVRSIISTAKSHEISIEESVRTYYENCIDFIPAIDTISRGVEEYKTEAHLLDYDDLLLEFRNALKMSPKFKEAVQKSFGYILVDEFQDTNSVQSDIVDLLADQTKNVTVVGDDTQSIYAFRGANFENILRFPQTHKDCKVVKLEENYRSQQGILDFTNDIVDSTLFGFKKKLFSPRKNIGKPMVCRLSNDSNEAAYVVNKIEEGLDNGLSYADFAILTRAICHSNTIQFELTRRGIPFIVVGGIKFSERRHIKDAMAFLKIVLNPLDAISWHRILRLIEGVGKVRASEIVEVIQSQGGKFDASNFKNRKYYDELATLHNLILESRTPDSSPYGVLKESMEFYMEYIPDEEDVESRMEDIRLLKELASEYDDLETFVSDFSLDPPSSKYQDGANPVLNEQTEVVTISTIHSSKGLEWHTVFVVRCIDGMLPSYRSLDSVSEVEEERRLFYVACSRAKNRLFITLPHSVTTFTAWFQDPSRFLKPITIDHYEIDRESEIKQT